MLRIATVILAPAAVVANGVSLSQQPAAGGAQALTITGSLATAGVATFDIPRRLGITSNGNDSQRTFTITGTDRYGRKLSETLAGPNNGTVYTANDYATITAISVDANTAGLITAGSCGVVSSPWYPCDRYGTMDIGYGVVPNGTVNYTVEQALEDPFTPGVGVQPAGGVPAFTMHAYPDPAMTGQTAAKNSACSTSISALRLTLNSYATGAQAKMTIAPGFAGDNS